MNKTEKHHECSLWHETLSLFGKCLSMFSKPYYQACDPVMREDDERLHELMKQIQVHIEQLYTQDDPLKLCDITNLVKRMKGMAKSNGLYRKEVENATITMIFHSLINQSYSLQEVKQIKDGMLIRLQEEWA